VLFLLKVLQRFALKAKSRIFLKALLCSAFKNILVTRLIENFCKRE
jgi:hypothetical protein